jgi:glucose/arabinose dehydrogenase
MRSALGGASVIAVLLAGCTAPVVPPPVASPDVTRGTASAPAPTAAVAHDLATGLDVPWDLAALPDGRLLVTLRDRAEVVRIDTDGSLHTVDHIEEVTPAGEGGLLGIALSPSFATDQLLYLYYSVAQENRVVRYRYSDTALTGPTPIITGIPRAQNHDGGRLRFGPDGNLYVATGDAGRTENAQDRNSLGGKILRVAADGSIPAGNPFGNAVYSYGHRNVQGIGWDAEGRMYASEFGQNTWDELNLIERGGNYGWPGSEGETKQPGLITPLLVWRTSEASPSGIAVTPDGTVYLAALRGERVWRTVRSGDRMATPTVFLDGLGRIRHVAIIGKDLLVLTNNTARGTPRRGDDRLVAVPLP